MIKRILVVDDEKETAQALASALSKEGYLTNTAFNGQQAKAAVVDFKPDLVVLDLIMPEVNGWQVLQWAKQEQKLALKIIILSGEEEMDDFRKGYALAADAYLLKPVNLRDLIKAVKTIFLLGEVKE